MGTASVAEGVAGAGGLLRKLAKGLEDAGAADDAVPAAGAGDAELGAVEDPVVPAENRLVEVPVVAGLLLPNGDGAVVDETVAELPNGPVEGVAVESVVDVPEARLVVFFGPKALKPPKAGLFSVEGVVLMPPLNRLFPVVVEAGAGVVPEAVPVPNALPKPPN